MPPLALNEPIKILFDSGAYTAWRSGKPIDLKAYCRFIKENEDWIAHYAVLDVIDPSNPERAAELSMENYRYMREQGLRPMPIYHVGENVAWLNMMLDDGAEYIGLSASSIVTRGGVDRWYSLMWETLCTPDGRPTVKTHAFGEGRLGSLLCGPWTSADTATWVYSALRAGVVRIGDQRLSHRKDGVSFKHAQDANALSGANEAQLHTLLDEAGVQRDALKRALKSNEGAPLRAYLAARHYLAMQDKVRERQPIRFHPHGLHLSRCQSTAIADEPFNFYLVCNNHPYAMVSAILAGAEHILCSYAYVADTAKRKFPIIGRLRSVVMREPSALDQRPYGTIHATLKTFLTGAEINA